MSSYGPVPAFVPADDDGDGDVQRPAIALKLKGPRDEERDGSVRLLRADSGQEGDDDDDDEDASLPFDDIVTSPALCDVLHRTLLPDNDWRLGGVRLVDGPAVTKFLKFLLLTALLLAIMFHVIRLMDWEYNGLMRLADLYTFESVLVVQDALVYFVVGRLHRRRGVDHAAFLLWCLAANLFASGATQVRFLQHSFTLYELHCRWPWQLWAFVGLAAPAAAGLVVLHVYRALRDGALVMRLLELVLCLALLLGPYLPSQYLHLHHWYLGWLIGMHCNVDAWWSRAALAWCWGLYVNGLAAYGRDPVLTCGYSYWLSEHMGCPYLQCYLDAMENSTAANDTQYVAPMLPPNWRNCSADAYHP